MSCKRRRSSLFVFHFPFIVPCSYIQAIEPTSALKLARGKWDLRRVLANDKLLEGESALFESRL